MIRVIAAALVGINLLMAVLIYEIYSLLVYFTNWCVLGSLACILLYMYLARIPGIDAYRKTLAFAHLLGEFTLLLNIITVLVYWLVIHSSLIVTLEGWGKFHMYLVHIFPSVAYCLNAKVTNF